MRRSILWFVLLLCGVAWAMAAPAQEVDDPLAALNQPDAPFVNGDRLLFVGDIITEKGDEGGGYLAILRQRLSRAKDLTVEIVNAGVSANRVPDLQQRLERDVLAVNPSVVFIQIGVNDAWITEWGGGTAADQYEAGLRDIITRMQARNIYVVLATPTVNGERARGENPYDATLDQYAEISRTVARDTAAGLCDLRAIFLATLKEKNADNLPEGVLTTNGIHLNGAGNALLAAEAARSIMQTIRERGPQPVLQGMEFYAPGTVTIAMRPGIPQEDTVVRYAIDGNEPTVHAMRYSEPFLIRETMTVTARAFRNGEPVGKVASARFSRLLPRIAENPAGARPGVAYRYYTGFWPQLPDFATLPAQASGVVETLDLSARKQEENFAFLFSGFLDVPQEGNYTFTLSSDDGSKLWIGDRLVVASDGHHGATPVSGEIRLGAGKHAFTLAYMQGAGGYALELRWASATLAEQIIPTTAYWHVAE